MSDGLGRVRSRPESVVVSELRAVGAGLRSRAVVAGQRTRRITAGPALVRAITLAAALSALILALPADTLQNLWWVIGVMAVTVAGFPRTMVVTAAAAVAVGAWLVTTIGFGEPAAPGRVAALAAALYLMHTGAALAAVLPYDAVVATEVLTRWLGRTAGVLAVSVGLGLVGTALAGQLPSARSVIGPIIGSALAAGLAGLLALHLRGSGGASGRGVASGE
jgi:hypothetical protein